MARRWVIKIGSSLITNSKEVGLQIKDSEGNVKDFMPMENYFPKMVKDDVLEKILNNPKRIEKTFR